MLYEGYAIWVSEIKLNIPENTLFSIQNLPNGNIKGLLEDLWLIFWLILKNCFLYINAPGPKNVFFHHSTVFTR